MKKIIFSFVLVCILFLTGCAATYQYNPPAGTPTATLTRSASSGGGLIAFAVDDDGKCPTLGYVKDDNLRSFPIPAGKRIWIEVGYSTFGNTVGYECIIVESFIPKENGHYYADYQTKPGGCSLMVSRFSEDEKLVPEESVVKEKFERCLF